MIKAPTQDFLGQELQINDVAVGSDGFDSMTLYKVIAFSPKMIRVTRMFAKRHNSKGKLVYGKALLKVAPEVITMYMLKYGDSHK